MIVELNAYSFGNWHNFFWNSKIVNTQKHQLSTIHEIVFYCILNADDWKLFPIVKMYSHKCEGEGGGGRGSLTGMCHPTLQGRFLRFFLLTIPKHGSYFELENS